MICTGDGVYIHFSFYAIVFLYLFIFLKIQLLSADYFHAVIMLKLSHEFSVSCMFSLHHRVGQ